MAQSNDSEQTGDTTFDELYRPLVEPLKQLEDEHPPHHLEKLSFKVFVRLLVYHFTKECKSGRLLLTDVKTAAKELKLSSVPHSTFFDAFKRFPVAWFVTLLSFLLTTVVWKAIPELAALRSTASEAVGKLYCVDGSLFPAMATMLWAKYTSTHNAVRLHLCFELNRMIPVLCMVDTGNSNEKKALLEMLEAGVTYIADRGYYSFPLLAAIVAANAFFVFRAKSNLVYTRVKRLPVDLPDTVQHIFRHVTDQQVRVSNAAGRPIYRLVSFYVGKERYLILTNRMDLTTFQVILLYAYRWQVELIFRFLKRSLNGLHLLSHSQEGVTIHFYALLIAALLELRLKQLCVDLCESTLTAETTAQEETDQPAITGLMINPDQLAGTRGSTFLATIGAKLHRYWKIGQHWLVSLHNFLAHPFDQRVIEVLGKL